MTGSSSSPVIVERRRRPPRWTYPNDDRCDDRSLDPQRRGFGGGGRKKAGGNGDDSSAPDGPSSSGGVRFSALLSRHLGLSRRQAERMMLTGRVTLFGKVASSPSFGMRPPVDGGTAVKVDGKLVTGIDDTLRTMHA